MDLSDKQELRWLSAIFADAGDTAPDVDFLIVGAMARDLLLHYGHGVPLDLIPFGGAEREDGTIEWSEDNAVMGLLGYREARATATQVIYSLCSETT